MLRRSFAYFQRATSARGADAKPLATNASGELARELVDAAGMAADVERARERRRERDDDAGLEVPGGKLHAHRVGAGEAPQRLALVRDAVLHAGNGDVRARRRLEALERRDAVLALGREQHDVAGPPLELPGIAEDRQAVHAGALGRVQRQAVAGDRLAVRAARDQDDLVPALGEPRADHPADRPRAVDDEAGAHSNAFCPVSARPRTSVWIWWVPS